jgi:hypothetical protein
MGLSDWLDPTRDWPPAAGPAPDPNAADLRLASLHFGDPLDSARLLGRPDQFLSRNRIRKDFDLLYASSRTSSWTTRDA